jgi:hypothetical protein
MAKYQGAYRDDLFKEEVPEQVETAPAKEPEANTVEEETFKKRYADLRRHMQAKTNAAEAEVKKLKSQLDSATKKQIRFPKSEKEIADWVKKYPDVAGIIDTIAQRRALEATGQMEEKMESLRQMETKIHKEKAEAHLKTLHPDFDEIRQDKNFHVWAEKQPKWIQDALYANDADALAAARAIDLYKIDIGKSKSRKTKSDKSAAEAVTRTASSSPKNTSNATWSESRVQSLSGQEFDKFEKEIEEAIRSGNFDYDVSGAAR